MKNFLRKRHKLAPVLLGVSAFLLAPASHAIVIKANINGNVVPIGDMSASNGFFNNDPATSKLGESGSFTLDAGFKYLMDDAHGCEFRWFQIVTADSGAPNWMGAAPTVPYTDPPFNGWDYQRTPPGNFTTGIAGDDQLPFYENNAEYAQAIPANNLGHDAAAGKTVTYDTPGLAKVANFNLQFQTYVVFFDPTLAANKKFVVLGGYSWGGSYGDPATTASFTFNGPTIINAAGITANLPTMQTALGNSGFTGWTALDGSTTPISCPDSGDTSLLVLVAVSSLILGRRRTMLTA